MDHSRPSGFWIERRPADGGCSFRWAMNAPRCGAPVTLHVQAESAIYGGVVLATCEPHAPAARAVGVYLDEHSPSWPNCRCKPGHEQPRPQFGVDADDLTAQPVRPDARLDLHVTRPAHLDRSPYDADFERRLRASLGVQSIAGDGYTHYYSSGREDGEARPLCGAGRYFTRAVRSQYVLTPNWRAVSCPDCRVRELSR